MATSDGYQESPKDLAEGSRDLHRALLSLREELEAIDSYQQRAEACADPQLKDVFLHNKDEELEHATMLMEWLRRQSPHLDKLMRTYLFTEAPITGIERAAAAGGGPAGPAATLGIGHMRGS